MIYIQLAQSLTPAYGATMEQAKRIYQEGLHPHLVESDEDVYMNPNTGSVDFESNWENLEGLVKVGFSTGTMAWEQDE